MTVDKSETVDGDKTVEAGASVAPAANGTTLDDLAQRAGLSVDDTIALAELRLRVETAEKILKLFGIANIFVLVFVGVLMIADWLVLGLHAAADR